MIVSRDQGLSLTFLESRDSLQSVGHRAVETIGRWGEQNGRQKTTVKQDPFRSLVPWLQAAQVKWNVILHTCKSRTGVAAAEKCWMEELSPRSLGLHIGVRRMFTPHPPD